MTEPNWTVIFPKGQVNAPREVLWVKLVDFVRGPRRLRIQAEGQWRYDPDSPCPAEGSAAEGFEDRNLHKTALRGCLLVKVGGSGGDTPGEGKIQAAGSYCVFDIPEGACGALFVTMNDDPKRFHLHSGRLDVTVEQAPLV